MGELTLACDDGRALLWREDPRRGGGREARERCALLDGGHGRRAGQGQGACEHSGEGSEGDGRLE